MFLWFVQGFYSTMLDQWKIRYSGLFKYYGKSTYVFGTCFLMISYSRGILVKLSFKWGGHWLSKYWKAMEFKHRLYLSLMGNQLTVSNSLQDTCGVLIDFSQKRLHLFCEGWILFFRFLERLGYHAEQA